MSNLYSGDKPLGSVVISYDTTDVVEKDNEKALTSGGAFKALNNITATDIGAATPKYVDDKIDDSLKNIDTYNKNEILSDSTREFLKLGPNSTPDDAFFILTLPDGAMGVRVEIISKNTGEPMSNISFTGNVQGIGGAPLITDKNGVFCGYTNDSSVTINTSNLFGFVDGSITVHLEGDAVTKVNLALEDDITLESMQLYTSTKEINVFNNIDEIDFCVVGGGGGGVGNLGNPGGGGGGYAVNLLNHKALPGTYTFTIGAGGSGGSGRNGGDGGISSLAYNGEILITANGGGGAINGGAGGTGNGNGGVAGGGGGNGTVRVFNDTNLPLPGGGGGGGHINNDILGAGGKDFGGRCLSGNGEAGKGPGGGGGAGMYSSGSVGGAGASGGIYFRVRYKQ